MVLTESILTTIQLWLASEDVQYISSAKNHYLFPNASDFSMYTESVMSFSTEVDGKGPRGTYPAIMCGVLCPSKFIYEFIKLNYE